MRRTFDPEPSIPAETRRQVRSARTRRGVIWACGAFLALQLGFGWLLDRVPRLRDPEYAAKAGILLDRLSQAGPDPFLLVALGSSRVDLGLRMDRLEREAAHTLGRPVVGFNLATAGAGPWMQLIFLRRLVSQGLRPDSLLIEIVPAFLANRGAGPAERLWTRLPRFTRDELALLARHGLSDADFRHSYWRSLIAPWYEQRLILFGTFLPSWLPAPLRWDYQVAPVSFWGGRDFLREQPSPDERERGLAWTRDVFEWPLRHFTINPDARATLAALLDMALDLGSRPVLLLMPEGDLLRSWYSPAAAQATKEVLDELASARSVPVIDARTWMAEASFSDSSHLLAPDAAAFSERMAARLARDVLQPRTSDPAVARSSDVSRIPADGQP